MPGYTVYGLTIASEIELPELVSASQDAGGSVAESLAVSIVVDPNDFSGRPASDAETIAWARPDDVCVRYPGLASYRVTSGRTIRVFVAEGADASLVRLFLLGPALAILLHQRKWLVLHASAVSINGRAAVFVGNKGYGKSTLAAALLARGHPLIADDLAPIDFSDPSRPVIHPGFPQLKIAPATAERLGHQSDSLSLLHSSLKKKALRAQGEFVSSPTPLFRIFVLAKGDDGVCQPLPPQQRFIELVRHSYVAPLLQSTGEAAAHFSQVAVLAASANVMELRRRWDLDDLPRTVGLVEEEMAKAASTPS